MVNVIGIVIVTLIVSGLGGAGAYLIWRYTRPPKITWKAKVYQLGEGIKPPIKDAKGEIISDLQLSDLRPYTVDVLEKIEKDPGITVYRLIKLNKVTPAVTNDCVDYWGDKNKEVSILLDKGSCTLLKKGYDRTSGVVFNPLSHSRINMIKGEMAIRKDRLRKEKDILQAITPWIVAGICMMGLVAIMYIGGNAAITMSENNKEAIQIQTEGNIEAASIMRAAITGKSTIEEEEPKEKPPPLEQ